MCVSKIKHIHQKHKFSPIYVVIPGFVGALSGAICYSYMRVCPDTQTILLSLSGTVAGAAGLLGTFIGIAYTFAIGSRDEGARIYRNAVGKKLGNTFVALIVGIFGTIFTVVASMIFMIFGKDFVTLILVGEAIGLLIGVAAQITFIMNVLNELGRRMDKRDSQKQSERIFENRLNRDFDSDM